MVEGSLFITEHFGFKISAVCYFGESVTIRPGWRYISLYRYPDGAETHGNCIVADYFGFKGDLATVPYFRTMDDVVNFMYDEIIDNEDKVKELLKTALGNERMSILDVIPGYDVSKPAMFFLISERDIGVIGSMIQAYRNRNW